MYRRHAWWQQILKFDLLLVRLKTWLNLKISNGATCKFTHKEDPIASVAFQRAGLKAPSRDVNK
jgi:hypothetical protein